MQKIISFFQLSLEVIHQQQTMSFNKLSIRVEDQINVQNENQHLKEVEENGFNNNQMYAAKSNFYVTSSSCSKINIQEMIQIIGQKQCNHNSNLNNIINAKISTNLLLRSETQDDDLVLSESQEIEENKQIDQKILYEQNSLQFQDSITFQQEKSINKSSLQQSYIFLKDKLKSFFSKVIEINHQKEIHKESQKDEGIQVTLEFFYPKNQINEEQNLQQSSSYQTPRKNTEGIIADLNQVQSIVYETQEQEHAIEPEIEDEVQVNQSNIKMQYKHSSKISRVSSKNQHSDIDYSQHFDQNEDMFNAQNIKSMIQGQQKLHIKKENILRRKKANYLSNYYHNQMEKLKQEEQVMEEENYEINQKESLILDEYRRMRIQQELIQEQLKQRRQDHIRSKIIQQKLKKEKEAEIQRISKNFVIKLKQDGAQHGQLSKELNDQIYIAKKGRNVLNGLPKINKLHGYMELDNDSYHSTNQLPKDPSQFKYIQQSGYSNRSKSVKRNDEYSIEFSQDILKKEKELQIIEEYLTKRQNILQKLQFR